MLNNIPEGMIWVFIKENFDRWIVRGPEVCVPSIWKSGHDSYMHTGINIKKNGVVHDFILGEGLTFKEYVKEVRGFKTNQETEDYLIRLMLKTVKNGNLKSLIEISTDTVVGQENAESPTISSLPDDIWQIKLNKADSFRRQRCVGYLKKRGFNQEIIDKYHLSFCESGYYQDRVIIPFYEDEKLIWFQARHIGNSDLKYLNPAGAKKSKIVYNIDNLSENGVAILTEGVMDAIIVDGLAIMGKELSSTQLEKVLAKKPSKIILALDQDGPGLDGIKKAAQKIKNENYDNVFILLYDGAKDLNELGIARAREVVKKAIPWDMLAQVKLTMMINQLRRSKDV